MQSNETNIIDRNGKKYIFDFVRKKYLFLTPEEWVRQNLLLYLVKNKNYPINLIRIEQRLKGKDMYFRADIVIYDRTGKPRMLIECKAENVKITQETFEQVSKYNFQFKVDYLMVTNGNQFFICKLNYETKTYQYLNEIPEYNEIVK